MGIIGVTHDSDGKTIIRRSITTKVAIGRGPTGKNNYPQKLDHFIFLRKIEAEEGGVEWTDDENLTSHYEKKAGGEEPTEVVILLLDDDIDQVFRTEYAWWVQTGKKCHGDGEKAVRRTQEHNQGEPWENCANSGKCREYESGECKPSADLYFMLADFPSLGTTCRLHTSSYQSIREIYTALVDLKSMMGGRLLGLPVKLFVRPEKNVYEDNKGVKKTGTKYVLGIELRAESLPKLLESVNESAKVFADLKKAMGGRRLELVENDGERAAEISGEFVHIAGAIPASVIPRETEAEKAVTAEIAEFHRVCDEAGLNKANRHMLLGRHGGDMALATAEARMMKAKMQEFNTSSAGGREPSTESKPLAEAEPSTVKKYGF